MNKSINNSKGGWNKIPLNKRPSAPIPQLHAKSTFDDGWEACRKSVLKILEKDIQNCDLSWDSCDSRYIEKIRGL